MKKGLSIKLKITLWFSVILIIVTALTSGAILYVSNNVIQKTIKDNLIETVDNNLDEIEFFNDMSPRNDVDQYISYNKGYLEIDDDYLNITNGISTALYSSDGSLLYGQNPIGGKTSTIEFADEGMETISADGLKYYVFDRELKGYGLDGLWLRGVVSSEQGNTQTSSVVKLLLYFVPVFVVFAIAMGFYFASRSLLPIKKISETAEQIRMEDDLAKRIELNAGNDELHQLADSFNDMLGRLEDAFEAERQFTSNASHELKTPLSVILAQCDFTLSDTSTEEDYREALETIQRQGNKMNTIISDMLTCTRLESGSAKITMTPVDLTELVRSNCRDMQSIRDKGIDLSFNAEKNVFINGNAELLSRMLFNLVSNAFAYGRENGHIEVELKSQGDDLLLSVSDDGIGIAEGEQEKIFRRFYQVDSSHNSNGAGLGLTLVSEIAKFHGGSISLESKLGEGSKFKFSAKKFQF